MKKIFINLILSGAKALDRGIMNYNINIKFKLGNVKVQILNIERDILTRMLQKHTHSDNSYELHYISAGLGYVVINNTTYNLAQNTLYVTGPNIEHEQVSDKSNPMEEYCIYFELNTNANPPLVENCDSFENILLNHKFWLGSDRYNVYPLFIQLIAELDNKHLGYNIQVESLIKQILVCMVRNYSKGKQYSSRIYDIEKLYTSDINDKRCIITDKYFLYEYSDITLNNLASKLGLGIRQTQRFLLNHYGKTFIKMKFEAKMNAATYLLMHGDYIISQIADNLGYSSSEQFFRVFKKYFGISPSDYLRQNRSH